jgi:hypothetical protein
MDFGKRYGYTFEHEATYDRICLVNDAVYIARYKDTKEWTATGTQFAVPYVFKKLFSKEPIEFDDMCETKSVKTAIYTDFNEGLVDVSEYEALLDLRRSGKTKGELKGKDLNLFCRHENVTDEELDELISEGHDLRFVGRVGRFCPIKPGCGGSELLREGVDKYGFRKFSSVTGAKDYRWLEAEMVKDLGKEGDIDRSYYDRLVDNAVEAISTYGDFEWFVSDDNEKVYRKPKEDYPWLVPCGKETCIGCPNFCNDEYHYDCRDGYDISNCIVLNKNNIKKEN